MNEIGLENLRAGAAKLRTLDSATKDAVLARLGELLSARESEILAANAEDVERFTGAEALRDRLMIDSKRLSGIRESLSQVKNLPDPVGEITEERTMENGLEVRKVRAPIGVIFMIFESRPNVAIEAFSVGFKAGNALILRGGKEAAKTLEVFFSCIQDALGESGLSDAFLGITDPNRDLVLDLLKQRKWIDLVVPRGGEGLIDFVVENSRIPIIKNDRGLCHVYVHEDGDLDMARAIVVNAKTQRPSVCNSMETLLVHRSVASSLLPSIAEDLAAFDVEWHGDGETVALVPSAKPAEDADWDTEYLAMTMNCRVVSGLDEALAHIERHGSRHSEAIVTASLEAAGRFQREVDAAATYWNASTRFTDGFALGLGAELGISTQKLHVRGPIGLRELTCQRWIVSGTGQVRP